ncbi:cytochrome c-type biogenesis protein CcmE [Mycobacterium sp. URHB0021]
MVCNGCICDVATNHKFAPAEGDRVVDVSTKTIMPAIVNPHGHLGYFRGKTPIAQNLSRAGVLDHLRRLLYAGVSAFQSLGTDRDDLELAIRDDQRGGRLSVEGPLPALFSAGTGIVAPTPEAPNGGPFYATASDHEAWSAEDARAHVRRPSAKRVDIVKCGSTTAMAPR